ncbi:transcriptional repressor LexA [Bisgaard Taxon 10/6]|uniref:LexA repressor n=1 Tax=Exercitatus varius TaxID=67857 RepID=A0AAW6Q9R7_9PAST|nr:transcriptional repressor LexA [Exercitatus varius]QOF66941.1 repressor LexA [Actinobacillus sp. GY-402]MDG2915250.1 transcriptional repressor LexA [Exercitatus varius]MDG2917419.1 transcriptional repressor LexA [Exercitatus varius]MDG2942284.1 transcriptional repressor LexA [Exercitatus varius]MDG2948825.1 transcriptional repressor LexA [Exercitatus varius]
MSLAKPLTARQQEVYNFLKHYIETTGMPPTRAEISRELGFRSPNAAEEHLKALARKGAVEILAGTSRGIRLLLDAANDEPEGLPLIGQVAAGEPILAEQHIEGTYRVDPDMFKPQADFLLKVNGQSMKNIGILDGDLLAVHSTKDVRNGQVIVARIEDEVTVKRLERKGDIIYLHAENEEFAPIVVNLREQERFEIEGIAVGIIRNNAWM